MKDSEVGLQDIAALIMEIDYFVVTGSTPTVNDPDMDHSRPAFRAVPVRNGVK